MVEGSVNYGRRKLTERKLLLWCLYVPNSSVNNYENRWQCDVVLQSFIAPFKSKWYFSKPVIYQRV